MTNQNKVRDCWCTLIIFIYLINQILHATQATAITSEIILKWIVPESTHLHIKEEFRLVMPFYFQFLLKIHESWHLLWGYHAAHPIANCFWRQKLSSNHPSHWNECNPHDCGHACLVDGHNHRHLHTDSCRKEVQMPAIFHF